MIINPKTLFRLLIVLLAAAMCCPMMAIAANSDVDSPGVSYYCSTADPLGITYTDAAGRTTRLFTDVVSWTEQGPGGYLAVATPDVINICRQGNIVQNASPASKDYSLLGWRRDSVIFRESGSVNSLDPSTGALSPASIGSDVVCIKPFPQGYLTIASTDNKVFLVQYDDSGNKMKVWKTSGSCGPALALVGNRYAVAEIFAAGGGNDIIEKSSLWIIDIQSKAQRTLSLKKPLIGFCAGTTPNEMLISLARAQDQLFNVTSTAIAALDLRTLKLREVFNAVGGVSPVGVSRGGAWLIATRAYRNSGPGKPSRLISIRLSDQKIRILQENVYECTLDN